jgi:hypothetical protein
VAGARPRRKEREGKKREGRKKGKRKRKKIRKRKKEGRKRKERKEKKNRKRKGKEIGKRFRKLGKLLWKLGRKVLVGVFRFPGVGVIFGTVVMARRTGRRYRGVRGIPGTVADRGAGVACMGTVLNAGGAGGIRG